jgi:ectoine hydroxylase-related dioxygenase (phytanoyl-CoA dioxygenase family)
LAQALVGGGGGRVEIGDWKAAPKLSALYRTIRELDLEKNVAELEAFGFTVIENVVPDDLVDRLAAGIKATAAKRLGVDEIPEDGSMQAGETQILEGMLAEGRAFEEAVLHPQATAMLRWMLGDSYIMNSLHAFVKGPDAPLGNLHIDSYMPDPLPRYSQVANVNFLLSDYTAEGGAIRFWPGSHKLGRHPRADERERADMLVPVEAPRGSLAVFHGMTWHGVCPKLTPGLRLNLIYFGCRHYIRPQEFYLDKLPQETIDRNPPEFRKLIGADLPFTDTTYAPDKLAGYSDMPRQDC